jgi:hypothetical protein
MIGCERLWGVRLQPEETQPGTRRSAIVQAAE